jgi:thiamine-monophosphate kinase
MREFEILEHVYAANAALPRRVTIPPGDDMAEIEIGGERGRSSAPGAAPRPHTVLAAVDQIVDGVHVRLGAVSLELIGRKAITRCLSDVAAMAAVPAASLVAATLPADFDSVSAMRLFDAMREAADEYDCPLIGGDVAAHAPGRPAPLVCAVTVLAVPGPLPPRRRSMARPGDTLYVTGRLGGSVAPDGGGRHLTFAPRIAEALELAAALGERLHAMIDVSDGLGRDAGHLARDSGVGIVIDADRIPRSEGIEWRRAASDGEDYELLFTAQGEVPEMVGAGTPVTAVGRVHARPRDAAGHAVVIVAHGVEHGAEALGWEHGS